MIKAPENYAVWLSTPNQAFVEIASDLGYRKFVLDLEHGLFDADKTDAVIALMLAQGFEVYAKVLGPEPVAIQRALDMACTGVIIPHIGGIDHAREITKSAKYPPLGTRSFSGTRPSRYGGADASHYIEANKTTLCFPMIESAEALADVEEILALPTVDGLFPGPSDLALSRGRGCYKNTEEDKADLRRIAEAAKAAGKPWVMPAWSKIEREEALALGASFLVVVDEYGSLYEGLAGPLQNN